jgi:hypothetical protein
LSKYYAIKRALQAIVVGTKRHVEITHPDPHSAARCESKELVDIWAGNSTLKSVTARLLVESFSISNGSRSVIRDVKVTLPPNRSVELLQHEIRPDNKSGVIVVQAKLLDLSDGSTLSRYSAWPEP